ncbi:MAG: formylmethanofuran dehydrogenase subunit C [Candidatus Methanomethylicota archaeon]|uniref:formylmethanofuran dehydrogenase n=1 Tax=Thermoproteota archaeon TaxID=2056631 RepID=A0A497EV40_9CREN|nr:MAG: formylmethanofuran dehydrogenase subunit C [Candidatus Verstraetearchaeota archaeon]
MEKIYEVILKPKREFRVPVELEVVTPNNFAGKSINEIISQVIYEGNRERKLGELFEVKGEVGESPDNIRIIIENSCNKLWRIGEGMSAGEIIVKGDVGHYLGKHMAGGKITVHGNAGSWVGAEMVDGLSEIHGNAGNHVGARFRGEPQGMGMKGGKIVIHGNAGVQVGLGMIKGAIIIDGDCLEFPGMKMRGGSILIRGNCPGRAGADMTGGKIVICGRVDSILPSFYIESIEKATKVKGEKIEGPFYMFLGDYLASRRAYGRLFVSIPNNPHLKNYAKLLEEGGE